MASVLSVSEEFCGSTLRTTSRRSSAATPDHVYAKAIKSLSGLSTASTFYSFLHYANLADFLNEPYDSNSHSSTSTLLASSEKNDSEAFVVFHTFTSDGHPQRRLVRTFEALQDAVNEPPSKDTAGTLIFLRGYQPAKWLNVIGARYSVDYEFYRRHLDFDSVAGRGEIFTDCSLPSNNTQMLHLSATTLGERSQPHSSFKSDHELLSGLRGEADRSMKGYLDTLSKRSIIRHGDSIVRHFSLHDLRLFSIEQAVSIYVNCDEKSWTAIIWLDFGRNLSQAGEGPWQTMDLKSKTTVPVHCKPTIQYRPDLAPEKILSHYRKSSVKRDDDDAIAQTACLLANEYGCLLDSKVACQDVYYALSDVFRFIASSEAQFLDLTRVLLKREMDPATLSQPSANKPLIMWNLVENKRVLDRHKQQLSDLAVFMETHEDTGWPESTKAPHRETAERAARMLLKNYRHLLRRAESISEDYDKAMAMLNNAAMIDESHRAIAQAEGVVKLTTLAFFFVPLSFTTSVFGMNFTELADGNHLRIWVWAVTAVASLFFSFLCLKWFSWRLKGRRIMSLGIGSKKPSTDMKGGEVV